MFVTLEFRIKAGGILGVFFIPFQLVENLGLHLKRVGMDYWKHWNAPLEIVYEE